MNQSTPERSRSGKNRLNSDLRLARSEASSSIPETDSDVTVDIAFRGKVTVSVRQLVKKLKWPALVTGFCACVLYAPQFDIEVVPGSPTPVEIRTQP